MIAVRVNKIALMPRWQIPFVYHNFSLINYSYIQECFHSVLLWAKFSDFHKLQNKSEPDFENYETSSFDFSESIPVPIKNTGLITIKLRTRSIDRIPE